MSTAARGSVSFSGRIRVRARFDGESQQGVVMAEKIFDSAFLSRLALVTKTVEQDDAEPESNDLQPLEPDDYEEIYAAYTERGGDAASARLQLARVQEQRDQAFGRILQFVSDEYGFGRIEDLDDQKLEGVARDALGAAVCWMEEVESQTRPTVRATALRALLKVHYQLCDSMLDLHDEILWPIAKRISLGPKEEDLE